MNCPLFWNVHLSMIQTLILIGKMDISKTDTGLKSILVAGALAWGLWKLQTAPRSDMILSGWIWEVFDDSVSFLKNQASKNGPNLKHAGTSVVTTRSGVFQDFPYFLMDLETSPMTFPCVWWWSKPPGPTTKIRIFSTDPLRCAASKVGWSQGREWWWVLGPGLGERLEGLELLEGLILMTIFVEPQFFLDLFDEQTPLQRFDLQVSICTWAGVTLPSTLELFSMSLGDLSSTSPSMWPGVLCFFSIERMMPVSQRYDFLPSSMKNSNSDVLGSCPPVSGKNSFFERIGRIYLKGWRHVIPFLEVSKPVGTSWVWSMKNNELWLGTEVFLSFWTCSWKSSCWGSENPWFHLSPKRVWEIHGIWYSHGFGILPRSYLNWPLATCWLLYLVPSAFSGSWGLCEVSCAHSGWCCSPELWHQLLGRLRGISVSLLVEKNGVPWTQPGQHPIHKEFILKLVWHSGPGT